jgi:glycosyltransferase involved in cell wall biosynthesis
MNKMAILSTFYPYRGGIAQFNTNLLLALRSQQIEVEPFTFSRQYPNFLFPGKTQFAEEKQDAAQAARVLDTLNPLSYERTAKIILKSKPDVLLTRYWMPFFAPSLGWVAGKLKRRGTKTLALIDNMIPHEKRPGDRLLSRYFLNQHDAFVVMSEAVRSDLLELKPDAKILQISHPLYNHFGAKVSKLQARQNLGIPADKKVVLFFGLIRRYKGLDLLIEAFEKLPSDYFLLIAGEPYEDISFYQGLLAKLPENSYLFHPQYIGDDKVADYFCSADLCALPYKSATQSGVVAIALHFGLPILATQVGSLADPIIQYGTGLVIESPEAEPVRQAINAFFSKNISYEAQIQRAQSELGWENFAQKLIAFCKQL